MSGRRRRRGAEAEVESTATNGTNGTAAYVARDPAAAVGAPPPRILPSFLSGQHSPRPRMAMPIAVAPSPAYASPGPGGDAPPPPPPPFAASAPPAPPPPPPAGAAPPNYTVENADAWRRRRQDQDERRWQSLRSQQPQGDTDILHVWSDLVRSRQHVPQGMTLWLTRKDAQRRYTIEIRGIDAAWTSDGEFPDRALWSAANRERRYPHEAEAFDTRIRSVCADGQYIEVGSGDLFLPPIPNAQAPGYASAPAPWGAQGGPPAVAPPSWPQMPPGWPPGAGYGSQASPWSGYAMTGAMGPAMQMMAMMEMMRGSQQPAWAQQVPLGTPPESVKNNPELLEVWKTMQQANAQQQTTLMTLLMEQLRESRHQPQQQPMGLRDLIGVMKDARSAFGLDQQPAAASQAGIFDHKGKTIVTKVDGTIDEKLTVGFTAIDAVERGISNLGTKLAAKRTDGGGGPSSPRPKGT